MFGHRKSPQIRISRAVFHNPLIIEFAAMRRALQPGPEYLQFRTLMRTTHQQRCIFAFTEAIDTNRIF